MIDSAGPPQGSGRRLESVLRRSVTRRAEVDMDAVRRRMLGEAWAALGGDAALLDTVAISGPDTLPARLPVTALAAATVGAASLAATELWATSGHPLVESRVDTAAVAVAFTSERHLRLDGVAPVSMDPLSAVLPAADGWVRLHGNYPHHRARAYRALGVPPDSTDPTAAAAARIADMPADEVERLVTAAGGLAVGARSHGEWLAHPQGRVVAALPLLRLDRRTDAPSPAPPARALLPAAGIRVLDLTRVIAGPVGGRTLALLGADVLRVDSPGLPEIPGQHLDTAPGKRSALLDLARPTDRASFADLLAAADVVLLGYRPGALEPFGLSPAALHEQRPTLVVATLSAWGAVGPDAHRRGFDSLVQVATGIGVLEGEAARHSPGGAATDNAIRGVRPLPLPAQALDHGTGYLLAAAVLRALTERSRIGGGWHAELSLAQTAHWLLAHHDPADGVHGTAVGDPAPWLRSADTPGGRIRYAAPPFDIPGVPADWAHPAVPWAPVRRRGRTRRPADGTRSPWPVGDPGAPAPS